MLIQQKEKEAEAEYNALVLSELQTQYKNMLGKLLLAFGSTVDPALKKGMKILATLGVSEGCDTTCTSKCYSAVLLEDFNPQCVSNCGCRYEEDQKNEIKEASFWDILYQYSENDKENVIKLFVDNMEPAVTSFLMTKQTLVYQYYDKFYHQAINDLGCNKKCIS
jgi:tRNA A37 methylthiotransferase MiaB